MLTHGLFNADGALHALSRHWDCRLRKVGIRQTFLLHISSRLLHSVWHWSLYIHRVGAALGAGSSKQAVTAGIAACAAAPLLWLIVTGLLLEPHSQVSIISLVLVLYAVRHILSLRIVCSLARGVVTKPVKGSTAP